VTVLILCHRLDAATTTPCLVLWALASTHFARPWALEIAVLVPASG